MPVPLLQLATEKFTHRILSDAERELIINAEAGRKASHKSEQGSPKGVINAECIEWLCTDRCAREFVTHRGVQICDALIEGVLDLDDAQMPFPIRAISCTFKDNICLERARLPSIALINCCVTNIKAAGVHVEGEAELNEGFQANGEVNFVAATIDGALDFQGAKLHNPKGITLYANRAKIGGSLYLRRKFQSTGEINITRATIGSNLDCADSRLINRGGQAINATSTEILGNVLLRRACVAGTVNLMAARIRGFVACEGAGFTSRKRQACEQEDQVSSEFEGRALIANSAKIDGSVLLTTGFRAQGTLEFQKTEVGGNLECTAGDLRGGDGATIDLEQASVVAFHDDANSWPSPGKLRLDGFKYERIYESPTSKDIDNRLKWLRLQPDDNFLPQPYEQLASTLKKMGHEAQARMVLIEKNKGYAHFIRKHFKKESGKPFRPLARLLSQEWWWYNVLGNLIGYGYKPWRAFGLSLIVIFFGWFMLHEGYKHKLISPTHSEAYQKVADNSPKGVEKKQLSEDYPRFNSFAYSIELFIPLLKFDQVSNWTPNANRGAEQYIFGWDVGKTGGFLRAYLCVHIVLGLILTSLWIGALTGLLKT